MARCEECIHEKVCLHRANIQTDTYAYMGVSYDTKSCKHFMPTADVVEVVRCGQCVYRTSGKPSCQGRHKDWFCPNRERKK